jgi:hypothetical protein
MTWQRIDLTGQVFGLWRVLSRADKVTCRGECWWLCQCACGTRKVIQRGNLKSGVANNCGCVKRRGPDLKGKVIGRLTVLAAADAQRRRWLCQCECGNQKVVARYLLQCGMRGKGTRSCGCLWQERQRASIKIKHGYTAPKRTSIYQAWVRMRHVCDEIAPEWKEFVDFLDDMGPKPPGTRLQRLYPDGGFCPENVQWVPWPKLKRRRRRLRGYLNASAAAQSR